MAKLPDYLAPETWLSQFFNSREALKGGVVKRQVRDVERLVGREAFLNEVHRRGFQVFENGRHFVVFCNSAPVVRLGGRRYETPSACSSTACILGLGKSEKGTRHERSFQQLHEWSR